jgi:hypothetical protein
MVQPSGGSSPEPKSTYGRIRLPSSWAEAYEAAGGLIRRDLFGDEDDGYMQDAELLESLALEKLNQEVEPLKEKGYAWVQVRTTFDYSDRAGQMGMVRREPREEERGRMETLEAEMRLCSLSLKLMTRKLMNRAKSTPRWRKSPNEFSGSWTDLSTL